MQVALVLFNAALAALNAGLFAEGANPANLGAAVFAAIVAIYIAVT